MGTLGGPIVKLGQCPAIMKPSLGVCLIGRTHFTAAQFVALESGLAGSRPIPMQQFAAIAILTTPTKPARILMLPIGVASRG